MNAKPVDVRPLAEQDKEDWHRLWAGYLEFYGAEVSDEVTAHTWERLMNRDYPVWGLVAEAGGEVAGILNYVLHANTWSLRPVCYLEDLYVDPAARGQGAGRALIEALIDMAKGHDWHRVYWMTADDNETARGLYDRITPVTRWVRYDVNI